jgi:hypothetical protein
MVQMKLVEVGVVRILLELEVAQSIPQDLSHRKDLPTTMMSLRACDHSLVT